MANKTGRGGGKGEGKEKRKTHPTNHFSCIIYLCRSFAFEQRKALEQHCQIISKGLDQKKLLTNIEDLVMR